ncbi:aminoacyl-tRNA hydrolase [Candidatus Photodesmus anomalopis]|uniref:Peptidyl-tRNA hydrolase n=1 Tax=Candidatus Photodesmus katoptron Akat1 TaxID=1236703 RepID=S3DJR2_9GAMM|nr:aminoacyl-tRNA hydrolase [Candidatus Photodesmus katoptron]EPE37955.1 peptidyl-tRNA hydrolase [Candidatus Photodesmus katoptron Akat1]
MDQEFKLFVGLANPGDKYIQTRHNAGSWVLEKLASVHNITLKNETKFYGLTGQIIVNNKRIHLLIPTTFMNLSGKAIAALVKFYQINIEEIMIAHDDLDLNPGIVKFKKGGSHGGHNGLRDIINKLNNKEFYRLRIGIGRPKERNKVSNYVLSKASDSEQHLLGLVINESVQIIHVLLKDGLSKAQNCLRSFKIE